MTAIEPASELPPTDPQGLVNTDQLRRLLEGAPMSALQVRSILILVILSMLDGYDVVSISYAAPLIASALHFSKAALGIVFSSGLVGMAIGSLLVAPLADTWGRRAAIAGALGMMIAGGLGAASAGSVITLAGSRVVSGLGIGTLVAVTTPLAAEFANKRRRALAVSITTMAFPMGAMLGGLAAAYLLREFGWQSVFVVKSIIAALLMPIVLVWLPESPSFLLNSRIMHAPERLKIYLGRCGHQVAGVTLAGSAAVERGYTELFAEGQLSTTLTLVVVNGLFAMVAYYWASWLPNMIVDAGFTASIASLVSATNSLSGVLGGVLLGFAVRWCGLRLLTIVAVVVTGIAMTLFGIAPIRLSLLTLAAAGCGFGIHATTAGLYTTIATSFPDHVRASGTGLVIGVGRITSAAAPLFAGWMFAAGYGRATVCTAFAALAICAALLFAVSTRTLRREPGRTNSVQASGAVDFGAG